MSDSKPSLTDQEKAAAEICGMSEEEYVEFKKRNPKLPAAPTSDTGGR